MRVRQVLIWAALLLGFAAWVTPAWGGDSLDLLAVSVISAASGYRKHLRLLVGVLLALVALEFIGDYVIANVEGVYTSAAASVFVTAGICYLLWRGYPSEPETASHTSADAAR